VEKRGTNFNKGLRGVSGKGREVESSPFDHKGKTQDSEQWVWGGETKSVGQRTNGKNFYPVKKRHKEEGE